MKKITVVLIIFLIAFSLIAGRSACLRSGKSKTKTGSSEPDPAWLLSAPSNLTATAISTSQINLSFQDNSGNENGFEIERSTDGITYTLLFTLPAQSGTNTTTYSDTGLTPYTTYYYLVRAYNDIDYSSYSNEASATTFKVVWSSIAADGWHTVALKNNNTVWAWGANGAGQLGLGDNDNRDTPTPIEYDFADNVFEGIAAIEAGYMYSIALKTDGSIWSWGENDYGQLGLGDTESANVPFQIGEYDSDFVLISADSDWAQVAAGGWHTIGIKTGATLWAWGQNNYGQLGDGTTDDRYTPRQVGTDSDWGFGSEISRTVSVAAGWSHTLGLKTNRTLWAWGLNTYGRLGDGTIDNRTTPRQIGIESDWSRVTAGDDHTIALKTNQTLWSWGCNRARQLGRSDNNRIPVQVGTDSDWTQVAVGQAYTLGIKTTGTLWSWGRNDGGQLGDGTLIQRDTPRQITTNSDWSMVTAGIYQTNALKTNCTIWVWGDGITVPTLVEE